MSDTAAQDLHAVERARRAVAAAFVVNGVAFASWISRLPAVRDAGPDAVVLADGFSCRTQLDQLAGRDGVHLAQLLTRATGA